MNRVVLITGTRKGIGQFLAKYFLEEGDFVVGCSRGEKSIIHERYQHYCIDITEEKMVVSMVKNIISKHKKIDILINNAGVAFMNLCVLTPYKTANEIIGTNFLGTFLMCREVSKSMIREKSGRIINYTSIASPLNLKGETIYAAAKSANEQFTRTLANELGAFNITVNTIGPNPIKTDLIKNVPEEKINEIINKQCIKQFGTYEDVLNVVNFYISSESKLITGQTIYLGGIS